MVKIKVQEIAYHRNGVTGNGFHVIKFIEKTPPKTNMLGIVFPDSKNVAVFDFDLLASGEIRFAYNSFRGDYYEDELRQAIEKWND